MDAKFNANAKDLLGKRGLKEADVADVVKSATDSKRRISNGKECIAKKRIGEVTVYAVYDAIGEVKSAYSHRMVLGEPQKTTDDPEKSEWKCVHCNEQAIQGTVTMTYMGITRSGPAVVCPKCGDSWVEEYLATKTIAAAEGLFEKKKA
jgi:hypothetical protein